jgi:hypothetical protein
MGDPQLRDYKVVGGLEVFADRSFWPNFFSRTVARLQWDPAAIDLGGDTRAWRGLRTERRRRLTTLLAGFCVAEEAVGRSPAPRRGASQDARGGVGASISISARSGLDSRGKVEVL